MNKKSLGAPVRAAVPTAVPTAALTAVLTAVLLLAGCGGANEASTVASPAANPPTNSAAPAPAPPPTAEALRGASVYRACVGCHGADPAARSLGIDKGVTVAALAAAYQKVAAMNPFSSSITAAGNADLAAYISSRVAPPTAAAPAPAPGDVPAPAPAPAPVAAAVDACESTTTPRRLTQLQTINVLTDFVTSMTNDAGLAASVRSVVENTAQLAPDLPIDPEFPKHLGFTRLDRSIGQGRGTALYTAAQSLATSMTATPERLNALLGACTAGAEACLISFIRKAGRQLYRRPVPDAELNALRNVAGGSTAAASVQKLLGAMMSSPQMYLVVERAPAQSTACVPLSGPELAARLSLHFWDSLPDAQLNDAADKPATDSTSLLHAAGYAAQVSRLVNDARAEAPMRNFFRQWFRLDELNASPLNGAVGTPKFDAFAAGFQPGAQTTANAIGEVLDMVSHIAKAGTLQDIFTNRQSFARTDDIATLYKTPRWDGQATPPTFTEPEREGLFGRIAFIANGSTDTTLPISRSVKILGALSCQNLGLPAIDQSPPAGAVLTGLITTRTRTERTTEQAGTACTGCHQPQINPWGFALERFDALGRVRAKEVVRDATGRELGQLDINTSTQVQLQGTAPRAVASLAEAQRYLLDSGHMERCFARNYVRYAFGRSTTAADEPLINAIGAQARQGMKLRELFAQVALRPEFKTIKGAAR